MYLVLILYRLAMTGCPLTYILELKTMSPFSGENSRDGAFLEFGSTAHSPAGRVIRP
jgi:hypothetical protein